MLSAFWRTGVLATSLRATLLRGAPMLLAALLGLLILAPGAFVDVANTSFHPVRGYGFRGLVTAGRVDTLFDEAADVRCITPGLAAVGEAVEARTLHHEAGVLITMERAPSLSLLRSIDVDTGQPAQSLYQVGEVTTL